MIFSGWVAIPRSILNNTHTGKLSNSEQLVLLTLMLLADAQTGSGYINAAAIRAYLPELKYVTAKRVLKSLEDKRLIYRKITHASNDLYPYWIHAYQVSSGPHKMSFTNISQVFVTDDLCTITYDADVPAMAPAIVPAMRPAIAPADAPNNNNDHDNDLHNDKPSYPLESEFVVSEGESASDSQSESNGEREVSEWCADGDRRGCTDSERMDALPPGYEIREDGNVYSPSGVKVHPTVLPSLVKREVHA